MRRALLTLGGTAAGLAALLSFKTHSLAAAAPAPSTPTATAGTSQSMAAGATPGTASSATAKAGKHANVAPKASSSAKAATQTVTGTVANTQYGPMQIQVTLSGAKITNVTVLQRTNDGSESDEIDSNAIPKLTSETLAAQSAHIDTVSGASYTSSGYIQSLQSALDKAGA